MKKEINIDGMLLLQVLSIAVIAVMVITLLYVASEMQNAHETNYYHSTRITNNPANFSIGLIGNSSNALFGVPNASKYIAYTTMRVQNISLGYNYQDTNWYYSLPFAKPIFGGSNETSMLYNFHIPASYSNLSVPIGVNINLLEFNNSNAADSVFNYIYKAANNNSVIQYYNGSNVKIPQRTNGSLMAVLTSNSIAIDGKSMASEYFRPIYTNLGQYQITFYYKNIIIIVNTYGILGKYDKNYTKAIASHYYETLSNRAV